MEVNHWGVLNRSCVHGGRKGNILEGELVHFIGT